MSAFSSPVQLLIPSLLIDRQKCDLHAARWLCATSSRTRGPAHESIFMWRCMHETVACIEVGAHMLLTRTEAISVHTIIQSADHAENFIAQMKLVQSG